MAFVSALAFAGTAALCATTDGSFRIDDPDARPSLYCRATDLFPPALTSVGGVLLDLLLFAGPTILVVVVTMVSRRRGRTTLPKSAGSAFVFAFVFAVATLVLAMFADVGYEGGF